ncbi:MAG: DNA polymerase III subunit alpha, partial [Lachnospiraceae bacterium]|nr:DNA polymerase III subunit alpha [Lachnospiraceae bacterium]
PYTRKQQMAHYPTLLQEVEKSRKDSLSGQFSLFDFGGMSASNENLKGLPYPEIGEYDHAQLLAFEKEVLGIYVSGHPLEADAGLLKKNVTALSSDFVVDEEEGSAKLADGARVTIGGMISGKTVKTTKNSQMMAFITVEDMAGEVEAIVFPKDYERYRSLLNEDEKVLVTGRVSIGDDPTGKLVSERIVPFSAVPKELWLQYENKAAYDAGFSKMQDALAPYDGHDTVVIYLKDTKQYKKLPASMDIEADEGAVNAAKELLGADNVKVLYKALDRS